MDIELRPITRDELPAFVRTTIWAFSDRVDEQRLELGWSTAELDRTVAAFDDGEIVGTGRLYSLELTLPGGSTLPVAAVSWIGVLPTHRRRRVLTGIMGRHLDDAVARGEALAVLHASEGVIYRRFGYGVASFSLGGRLERRHSAFLRPVPETGRIRLVDADEARKVFPDVFERARRQRPGAVSRADYWWEDQFFHVDKKKDEGAGFFVVHENGDGAVDGFAAYRVKHLWQDRVSQDVLEVEDLVTTTSDARAVLWRYLCDVDLIDTITIETCAVDEPLRWLLTEARRFQVDALGDNLWVRILDVPAALRARAYAVPGRVVLDVTDEFRPQGAAAGRFALEVTEEGSVHVEPTTSAPDLSLAVTELGAAYLGGVSFASLAAGGLVREETPGAIARADLMFHTEPAPYAMTMF